MARNKGRGKIPLHQLSYDKMRKRGKMFGGRRYKYFCFVPDVAHQGTPGHIDKLRKTLQQSGLSVRTVRTATGWDVFERRPWYRL